MSQTEPSGSTHPTCDGLANFSPVATAMKLLSNVDLEAAFEERGLGSMFRELKLGQYIPSKKEFKQAGAMGRAGYSALLTSG